MAEETVRLLKMHGDRIVDTARDSPLGHFLENPITVLQPHNVQVIDVTSVLCLGGQDQLRNFGQVLAISPGMGAS